MLNFTKEEKLVLVFFVGSFLLGSVAAFLKAKATPRHTRPAPLLSETNRQESVININKAAFDKLIKLKGIGPKTAMRIIDYRTNNGPFFYKEDLMKIKGIGRAKFDRIKDRVATR